MTGVLEFTSEGLAPEAAFEAYQRLYARGSDVSRGPGFFHAHLRAVRLGSLILYDRRLNGVTHARGERVADDGFNHFAVHLVLAGRLEGSPESGFDEAGPGDLVLVDTLKPSRTTAHDLHVLTASVSRGVIAAAAGPTARLHGHVAPAPSTLVLGDVMQSLVRHGAHATEDVAPGLRRAFGEALSAALSTSAPGALVEARRLDLAQRDAATRFIESHISDRGLDASVIAEGLGLSRSALYRLFQPYGGVSVYVMARRIAAVRDALETGSTEPLSDLASRFGFTDESHLNRRFSRVYGQPVGSYRRAMAMETPDSDSGRARRFAVWMTEIQ